MNILKLLYKIVRRILITPRETLQWLYNFKNGMRYVRFLKNNKDEKIILLIGIHEYSNIGDHAICVAERELLENYFPNHIIVEMTTRDFRPVAARLKAVHCEHAVIAVPGGGYLGTLWMTEEIMFRDVLKTFPQNKVVVLPQTIFFGKSKKDLREVNKSVKAYNSHSSLTIFIRDKSIEYLKEVVIKNHDVKLFTVPDIVLFLNRSEKNFERYGILFCLRNDKEKVLKEENKNALIEKAKKYSSKILFTDTCEKNIVPPEFRNFAIEKKFDEFRKAKLVITDRLHGMIFATITGTPCIAMNNISAKVQGVYVLWLKDTVNYVKFAQSEEEVLKLLPQMIELGGQNYNPRIFEAHWKNIAQAMKE